PADATVTVTFGPGTPSAEGPRRTTEPASFTLRTFGPLRVTEHRSGWGRGDCPPGAPFMITFSNPIDADALTPDMITLAPEVPGLRVTAHGSTVHLQGATAANTRYEATLSPALKDVFGQTLGAQATLGFATTAPHPALVGQAGDMVILDPAGKPRLTFTSISVKKLRARVHAVDPATDWAAYQEWRRGLWRDATPPMPGRKVSDVDVSVKGSQEAWAETTVDLSAALKDGLGHAVVLVEPVDWPARDYGRRPRLAAWVQGTRLGLDAQHDATDLLAWVTQLADGAPVAGAQVRLLPTDAQAETGADGVARLILRPPARSSDRALLASLGADVALLPGDWSSREPGGELRWFTFDDRHLYRPGEQVRVKGWVRHVDHRVGGDVRPAPANLTTTRFVVRDARWQEVTRGEARFDPLGGFDLDFTLPDTVHVGQAVVEFDRGHHHAFQIAEFRRPEFEVTVSPAGAGPALATEDAVFTAAAAYFAGGARPGAKVTWRATARPTHFTPPNRRDFLFGEHVPWWLRGWSAADDIDDHPRRGRRLPGRPSASQDVATLAGTTDAQGKHHLRVTLNRLARPLAITAEATVQDVNRQAFAGASTVLAHPAAEYVGLRPRRPFFRQGDPLALDLLVVGLDGVAVAGRAVHVELARLEWDWDHRGLRERVVERHAYALT
ncbi:MAG: hypothetical protein KIT58_21190, partial [Planctomycetota bacterium]|nr:hypothetical protein [Planctomycetota bacterium]